MNSPALRKPKKPRHNAAHSMNLSGNNGPLDQVAWILLRRVGVICSRLALGLSTLLHRKPLSTYSRRGNDDNEGERCWLGAVFQSGSGV